MPRAKDPTYRQHFTAVNTLSKRKWRCNICIGRGGRGRLMNRRQAKFHGSSGKHTSKEESAAFFKHPGNFIAVDTPVKKWRCNICIGSRGGTGRVMTRKRVAFHEISSKHSSKVAATFFQHPKSFKYVDNGKWLCQICKADAMGVKKAVAHEVLCQRRDCNFQVDEEDENNSNNNEDDEDDEKNSEDEDEDDTDDDDNDDNNDGDTTFIENFLRLNDVDASRKQRMRSFYKMPTEQKIQGIQEVIRDLRAVMPATEGI